jgi:hypothetical protein
MTGEDLSTFMKFDNAAFIFLPLSARREIDPKIAEKYASIAVPPEVQASSYPLTAPVYAGIRLRNELFADTAEQFLYSLVQEDTQSLLSRETGLAPANAKTTVPTNRPTMSATGQPRPGFWYPTRQPPRWMIRHESPPSRKKSAPTSVTAANC